MGERGAGKRWKARDEADQARERKGSANEAMWMRTRVVNISKNSLPTMTFGTKLELLWIQWKYSSTSFDPDLNLKSGIHVQRHEGQQDISRLPMPLPSTRSGLPPMRRVKTFLTFGEEKANTF